MGNYQLPTKITFYPSYPLYAYSIGILGTGASGTYDDETHYSAISLNPSKIIIAYNNDSDKTINAGLESSIKDFIKLMDFSILKWV